MYCNFKRLLVSLLYKITNCQKQTSYTFVTDHPKKSYCTWTVEDLTTNAPLTLERIEGSAEITADSDFIALVLMATALSFSTLKICQIIMKILASYFDSFKLAFIFHFEQRETKASF